MYGLVNRAVEGLVRQQFGDETWDRIRERAGVGGAGFGAMETYDDKITYDLVGAASSELDLPPEKVLEAFGEYWTRYTIEEGYGDLLTMMGSTFDEFIDNLDSMHARLGHSMPGLIPPSFDREELEDGSSILHYHSERQGLAPMVVGLLRGLAQRFEVEVGVEQLEAAEDGHARFKLTRG